MLMATDSRARTEQLSDVYEIQQVLYKYAVAVDARASELLGECFAADAIIDMVGVGSFSLPQFQEMCRNVLWPLDATQHCISTPIVGVDGDRATSRCYSTGYHARNSLAAAAMFTVGGQYDDVFERQNRVWRIVKRVGTIVWVEGNPAVVGFPAIAGGMPWSDSRNVPSWLR
jgi:3-phenylpropionate/cinnamic acid dioxygenase small subunit